MLHQTRKKLAMRAHATMPDFSWPHEQVVVGVLTGGRPQLLQRTLAQTFSQLPRSKVHLVVLINGGDEDTLRVVEGYYAGGQAGEQIVTPEMLPIGAAVSLMAKHLPQQGVYFHLEDDWSVHADVTLHLCAAAELIRCTDAGHVKLRHFNDEKTNLSRQGCAIKWEAPETWYWRSNNASFTFNPAVTRMDIVHTVFDCRGEYDAQEKYEAIAAPIVQMIPGCYIHADEGDSLRKRRNLGHRDDLPF